MLEATNRFRNKDGVNARTTQMTSSGKKERKERKGNANKKRYLLTILMDCALMHRNCRRLTKNAEKKKETWEE